MGKTYYYKDELNDDFAGTDIKTKKIPIDYKYFSKNPIRRVWAFIFYHFIATPIVFILQKLFYREKIIGRKKLKKYKKSGFFIYGNHTRAMGDAYEPSLLAFPKKAYIITSADAVSIPFVSRIVEDLGGVPVPDSIAGMKNFYSAIKSHAKLNHIVAIYPEAHIWPYYTDIRPFNDSSFFYPVKYNKPVFTFTATYKKGLFGLIKTTVYVDGPYLSDGNLSVKENQSKLRDMAYAVMKERSKLSTFNKNEYIKQE